MNRFDVMSKLPLIVIVVFLIILIILLTIDRSNILDLNDKHNELKNKQDTIKDKISNLKMECPTCPVTECPACPQVNCPAMKCPEMNCPENKVCPQCPNCPECPMYAEKTCPVCSEQTPCPVCDGQDKECPVCAPQTQCPDCPACPVGQVGTLPTAKEIAEAIFPGRNTGIVMSGEYYPVDDYVESCPGILQSNVTPTGTDVAPSVNPVFSNLRGYSSQPNYNVIQGGHFLQGSGYTGYDELGTCDITNKNVSNVSNLPPNVKINTVREPSVSNANVANANVANANVANANVANANVANANK